MLSFILSIFPIVLLIYLMVKKAQEMMEEFKEE